MITIQQTENNKIENMTSFKKNNKTKEIFIKGSECNSNYPRGKKLIAKNNVYNIYHKTVIDSIPFVGDCTNHYFIVEKNEVTYRENIIYESRNGLEFNFVIKVSEPLNILEDFNNIFYYVPYNPIQLKPMPKIDKLIDSSSFENVSTKLQEINNLLKVSSDNLKTIMDANNLLYEPTDNFRTLVKKLNSPTKKESTLVRGDLFQEIMYYNMPNFKNVVEIHFIKDIPDSNGVDVSEAQDKSIMASINDQNILKIACNGEIIANADCNNMFNGSIYTSVSIGQNINKISFDNFNTKNVTSMRYMFGASMAGSDSNPESTLDVVELSNIENWDVSNVLDMEGMFRGCHNLENINLSKWNVSNVKNMKFMFDMEPNSPKIIKIEGIENWNTKSLENTEGMFRGCNSLQSLNLKKWNTLNITNMNVMFMFCTMLNGEITIMNDKINADGFFYMFAASSSKNSKFIVNYTTEQTKTIAMQMIETKLLPESNVILGKLVTQ